MQGVCGYLSVVHCLQKPTKTGFFCFGAQLVLRLNSSYRDKEGACFSLAHVGRSTLVCQTIGVRDGGGGGSGGGGGWPPNSGRYDIYSGKRQNICSGPFGQNWVWPPKWMLARTPMCQTYLALIAVNTTSCYAQIILLSSSLFILSALFVEDVHDVIVSIAHRGRLNLLTCVLQFEPVIMFRKVDTSVF